MAAIGKERELRPHWQRVREVMLQEADVAALSSLVRLAVLMDACRCPIAHCFLLVLLVVRLLPRP